MNSYFTMTFMLLFLPMVLATYQLAPRRLRGLVLLVASYAFAWRLSGILVGFTIATAVVTYAFGLAIGALLVKRDKLVKLVPKDRRRIKAGSRRKMSIVLALGIVVEIAPLFALKYLGFFSSISQQLGEVLGIGISRLSIDIGAPVGISFYTLTAISYLIDVYRERVPVDRNPMRVALFMGNFPQLMEGPICRYSQSGKAVYDGAPIVFENLYQGSLRILFGVMKKLVVADRLNTFVTRVFDGYESYDGGILALAAVLYTLQLYCDFSGAMDVVIGIARIFGVELPENFRQPFFSRTASEFWQRWHITLGAWFKDYVYYPISLSKAGKSLTKRARRRLGNKYGPLLASSVALLVVWLGNGLWHGAGSQYVLFGLYYFVIITLGGLVEPIAQSLSIRLGIDRDCRIYRSIQIIRTLLLVFVGELFFRSSGWKEGFAMFSKICNSFSLDALMNGTVFTMGIDLPDCAIVAFTTVIILLIDIIKERGIDLCSAVTRRGALVHWCAWTGIFLFIVVFGAYGLGYVPVDPMYAKF